MKTKLSFVLMAILVIALVLTGCSSSEEAAPAAEGEQYIAVISKGFQHQFWQAVAAGAEQAAEDYDVTITFEGPETEAQVDKQVEMVQAALDKNPAAIMPRCIGYPGFDPLVGKSTRRRYSCCWF